MREKIDRHALNIAEPQTLELARCSTKSKPMLFEDFTIDPSYKIPPELLNDLELNLSLVHSAKSIGC